MKLDPTNNKKALFIEPRERRWTVHEHSGEPYYINNNVKLSIRARRFYGCKKLKKFIVPNSVTSIEKEAFGNCKNLKTIILPNSLTSIGE